MRANDNKVNISAVRLSFVILIASLHFTSFSQKINYDSLKIVLNEVHLKDQTFRRVSKCFREKYGNQSNEMYFFWSTIKKQDSLNLITVTDILNKYGWLGKSVVGSKANNTLFLVIQHSKLDVQEQFIHLFKESVDNNESSAANYGTMLDRILVNKGCEQEYGTQFKINTETGKYELLPIRDQKNINKRRIAIGLDSISTSL